MTPETKKSILAVDDSPVILKMVQELLKDRYFVHLAKSPASALGFLQQQTPDIILLDVEMPAISGYDFIKLLKEEPAWAGIPVVFLSSMSDHASEERGLAMGAVDYIFKPISPGILRRRVEIHLELLAHQRELSTLVKMRTEQLARTRDAVMEILSSVTEYRDNETGAHLQRTTRYVEVIVEALKTSSDPDYFLDPAYGKHIIKAAKLHDIGKVAIPDYVLLKPSRLTQQEFDYIKEHTIIGRKMIQDAMEKLGSNAEFLSAAAEIAGSHHECWDGSGYPAGISGKSIPLSGRIMAIADVYDALISTRPYKPAGTHEAAVSIILSESGTHFDPSLIALCEPLFETFSAIARDCED